MATLKYAQIKSLILEEHQAGSDASQAVKNICNLLGVNAVTLSKVNYWYKRFDSGDMSIVENKPNLYFADHPSYAYIKAMQSLLFQLKGKFEKLITNDGRIGFSLNCAENGQQDHFVMTDLFNSEIKAIPIESNIFATMDQFKRSLLDIMMVDDKHFLAFLSWLPHLVLIKLDRNSRKLKLASSTRIDEQFLYGRLATDKQDASKFVIYNIVNGRFTTGHLSGARIILGKFVQSSITLLYCMKLSGNIISGLRPLSKHWEYCEFDIGSLKLTEKHRIALKYRNGEKFELSSDYGWTYVWSGNRLYASAKLGFDFTKIVVFDAERRFWSDVNLAFAGQVRGIFVDENEVMTVQVSEKDQLLNSFYRYSLKKPESLMNLSWISMSRSPNLHGSNIFERVLNQLPSTCSLHSKFPN